MSEGGTGGGWAGQDLSASEWRVDLSDRSLVQIMSSLQRHRERGRTDMRSPQLARLDEVSVIRERLLNPNLGFAVLSHFPVRDVSISEVESVFMAVGEGLGTPVTQSNEKDFVGHVQDQAKARHRRGYTASGALEFHCDLTHITALLSLRSAKSGGLTALVSARHVFEKLRAFAPDLVSAACGPYPIARADNVGLYESGWSCWPIFALDSDRFGAFFTPTLTELARHMPDAPPITNDQLRAVDVVKSIANQEGSPVEMLLAEGDVLFVNNRQVWHARSRFIDHSDFLERRHLLRLWLESPEVADTAPAAVDYEFRFGAVGLRRSEVSAPKRSPR